MAISIDVGTIEDAVTVGQGIPEFEHKLTKAQIEERIAGRPHLILIANESRKVVYVITNYFGQLPERCD